MKLRGKLQTFSGGWRAPQERPPRLCNCLQRADMFPNFPKLFGTETEKLKKGVGMTEDFLVSRTKTSTLNLVDNGTIDCTGHPQLCYMRRVVALLLALPQANAVVSKDAVASLQCQVCEHAVEEAIIYSKENKISSEDDLNDMIDGLCSVKKKEGRWVAHLDIVQEDPGGPLSVEKQDVLGYCKGECTVVQRACQSSLRGKEESLASMLQQDTGNKKMKEKVCKKICEKKRPKIADWKDELFEPRDPKEVETQDMMAKMKAETGMSMKMYSREELEMMTDGDMETMAAREAFASERQAARMMERAEMKERGEL
eukprot:s111_g58.t3